MVEILWIVLGVVFLYFGSDGLVRSAVDIALRLRVKPLVVGLTLVSLCTSMPEAVASFEAQIFGGLGDVALGNILGSNIANVGLILGITALVCPLPISPRLRRETPIMVLSLLILIAFMLTGSLSRLAGLILLCLLLLYLAYQIWSGREQKLPSLDGSWLLDTFQLIFGALLLAAGGYLLLQGSIEIARVAGLSERFIGLTIIAIGTSLPELGATLTAALRGHPEIAIGNVVGSNVFNALFIGGGASLIRPIHFDKSLLMIDAPVMLGFSLLLWLLLWRRDRLGKRWGALFLVLYAIYLIGIY